uniref:Uncharacterized protein n=1 Tax=Dromaius novaehollandiae TaxID=8790 RepID=A0A8C4JC30_DRONO
MCGDRSGGARLSYLLAVLAAGLTAVLGAVVRADGDVVAGAHEGVGRGQFLHGLVLFPGGGGLRVQLDGGQRRAGLVVPRQVGAARAAVDRAVPPHAGAVRELLVDAVVALPVGLGGLHGDDAAVEGLLALLALLVLLGLLGLVVRLRGEEVLVVLLAGLVAVFALGAAVAGHDHHQDEEDDGHDAGHHADDDAEPLLAQLVAGVPGDVLGQGRVEAAGHLALHHGGVGEALVDEDVEQGGGGLRRLPAVVDLHHQAVQAVVLGGQLAHQRHHAAGRVDLEELEGVAPDDAVVEVGVEAGVGVGGHHGGHHGAQVAGGRQHGVGAVAGEGDGGRVVVLVHHEEGDGGGGGARRLASVHCLHLESVAGLLLPVEGDGGVNGAGVVLDGEDAGCLVVLARLDGEAELGVAALVEVHHGHHAHRAVGLQVLLHVESEHVLHEARLVVVAVRHPHHHRGGALQRRHPLVPRRHLELVGVALLAVQHRLHRHVARVRVDAEDAARRLRGEGQRLQGVGDLGVLAAVRVRGDHRGHSLAGQVVLREGDLQHGLAEHGRVVISVPDPHQQGVVAGQAGAARVHGHDHHVVVADSLVVQRGRGVQEVLALVLRLPLALAGRLELEGHVPHHGAGHHAVLALVPVRHLHQCDRSVHQHVLGHAGHAVPQRDAPDFPDVDGGHVVVLVADVQHHRGLVCLGGLAAVPGHDGEAKLVHLLAVDAVQDAEPARGLVQPQQAPHGLGGRPEDVLDLPVHPHVQVGSSQLQDGGPGAAVLRQVCLVDALLEAGAVVVHVGDQHPQDSLRGAGRVAAVPHSEAQLVGVPLLPVQRPLDDQLRLLLPVEGVGHLQLEHAAPGRPVRLLPPLAAAGVEGALGGRGSRPPPAAAAAAAAPGAVPAGLLQQLVALDAVAAEVPVGGGGKQVEGPHGPVLLHGEREDGGREGGGVVVDVQDDDPALEEVHPALRGADDRHLEVQETLVLVEDHLALRQLLAVDAPLRGAQLPGHVIDLEVVGARFQAECHLAGARHDTQVGSHVADADVGGSLLGQPVPQELLGRRQADPERRRQEEQEAAAAAAMHKAKESPHLPHLLRTEIPPPLTPTRPPINSPDKPTERLSVRVINYKILLFLETYCLMAGAIGGQNPAAGSSAVLPAFHLRYTYSSRDSVFCFLKIHLGR